MNKKIERILNIISYISAAVLVVFNLYIQFSNADKTLAIIYTIYWKEILVLAGLAIVPQMVILIKE